MCVDKHADKTSLLLAVLFSLLLVSSCGGGSSSDDSSNDNPTNPITTIPPTNLTATANAGANRSVNIGETIQLDGTQSDDPENDSLTYLWELAEVPTGSNTALNDSSSATPSLTIDLAGTYIISLVVSDGNSDSTQDFVVITTLGFQTVSVNVPDSLTAGDLKVLTSNMVSAETLSTVSEAEILLDDSKQLILITDTSGNVVFLGFGSNDSSGNIVVDEYSTAEVLVTLFPSIAYILAENPAREDEINSHITSLPEVSSLATIIKNRVDSGNTDLMDMDDTLLAAVASAIDAATEAINSLLGVGNNPIANRVALDGSNEEKSGLQVSFTPVTVDEPGLEPYRLHEVTINNSYQRYVTAGIYQNDSRIVPVDSIIMIDPGGVGKLSIDPEAFIDGQVEIQVFGPGLLANAFDPGWSDNRVLRPTLRTVIKDIAIPVLKTILGNPRGNLLCSALPSADDLLIAVVADAAVVNAAGTGDLTKIAMNIIGSYLRQLRSGLIGNISSCAGEALIATSFASATLLTKYLALYDVLSTSLDVGEVVLDVADSHRNEWWILRNSLSNPTITFDPLPVGSVAPLNVTFHGDCQFPAEEGSAVLSNQEWVFEDGGTPVTLNDVSLSTISHHYDESGTYTITLTCPDADTPDSPQSNQIQFTLAEAQPSITVEIPALNQQLVDNSATAVNFGPYPVGGADRSILFSVSNSGTGDPGNPDHNLNIQDILLGSIPSNFQITNLSRSSIPVGESATFSIIYSPQSAGVHNNQVTINSDNGISFTFSVAGNAFPTSDLIRPKGGTVNSTTSVELSFHPEYSTEAEVLVDAEVIWSSSIDGELGEGHALSRGGLSLGSHVITAHVTTSQNDTFDETVVLLVRPEVETEDPQFVLNGTISAHLEPDGYYRRHFSGQVHSHPAPDGGSAYYDVVNTFVLRRLPSGFYETVLDGEIYHIDHRGCERGRGNVVSHLYDGRYLTFEAFSQTYTSAYIIPGNDCPLMDSEASATVLFNEGRPLGVRTRFRTFNTNGRNSIVPGSTYREDNYVPVTLSNGDITSYNPTTTYHYYYVNGNYFSDIFTCEFDPLTEEFTGLHCSLYGSDGDSNSHHIYSSIPVLQNTAPQLSRP